MQRATVRASVLGVAAAGLALGLGAGGWAAAQASRPAPADVSAGRVLQLRYEVRRPPAYQPPPPTEETRLDVQPAAAFAQVDEGVLAAQAAAAYRSMQAEDDARMAAALRAVRAEDARYQSDASPADADPPPAAGDERT